MTVEIRLRALERNVNGGKLSPGVSLILADENGWRLLFSLWDGVTGSKCKIIESTHGSEAAAQAEYERLLKRYHAKDAPMIILDI